MKVRTIFFLVLVTSCAAVKIYAQNNTSPYSMIGIGDIEKSSFDRTTGMGHAGLALSSNRYFYQANPASYSKLDEHFFYFEFAARYKSVNYSGKPIVDPTQSNSSDLQFKKLAVAIKPLLRWTISAGLLPFSTVNYSFTGKKNIQGSDQTTAAYYEGSGGTNQFYISNSYAVSKHFSIGVQASYLFGQLQETETLSTDFSDSVLSTSRNIFIGSPYFKLGFQYNTQLSKKLSIAVGGTVANKKTLRADYSLLVKDGNSTILEDEYYKSNYFTLPAIYTGGIAAVLQDTYTFAADYNYQGWSNLNYKGLSYALVNSQRISVGAEYAKKLHFQNQSGELYFLQTGFFYSNSYLRIGGEQIAEYGATFGGGFQLPRRMGMGDLALQGSMEVGARGTTNNGLIKEKFTQFNFTLSYRDFWVSRKMKKYD